MRDPVWEHGLFHTGSGLGKMNTDLELVLAKMKELQRYAEILMETHTSLSRYRCDLNDAWVSDETEEINRVLERMNLRIRSLSEELYGIGCDMIRACEEP